eukprot:7249075-Ditylum_brightwellii.AAC.1
MYIVKEFDKVGKEVSILRAGIKRLKDKNAKDNFPESMACSNILAHKNPIDIATSALNSIAVIVLLSLPDLSQSDSLLQNTEKLTKRIGEIYNNKDELLKQSK